ncbi:DUF2946 family protein [Paludibacterium yongneupense]|uniref:DUF2946 family protein n=1 Tax=Paludibacterium yongneupense TaxID=400061 RepID=UPI0012EB3E4C|nr:DUF2946 family protein [Paludibacterium yongneupense]
MLKCLRVFYLLLAVALLPLHARAMEFAHLQTQIHASCSTHGTSGHDQTAPGHMDGDCCQLHPGTLPAQALSVVPAVSTPLIALVATPPSPTRAPPERPPRV